MSEPAADKSEKKKGGKLPIVLVLGGMLAAGGYFGMQSRAPKGPVKEPEPALGAMVDMAPEFIVNLREREYFLRASIAFQMDKNSKLHLGGGGDGHGGKGGPSPEMTALRDVITERLSSLSVSDLRRPDFYARLRKVLADDANRVLALVAHHEEEEKPAKDDKKSKKGKDDHAEEEHHAKPKASLYTVQMDPHKLEHPDWDSEEGPILKVYITGFATQKE